MMQRHASSSVLPRTLAALPSAVSCNRQVVALKGRRGSIPCEGMRAGPFGAPPTNQYCRAVCALMQQPCGQLTFASQSAGVASAASPSTSGTRSVPLSGTSAPLTPPASHPLPGDESILGDDAESDASLQEQLSLAMSSSGVTQIEAPMSDSGTAPSSPGSSCGTLLEGLRRQSGGVNASVSVRRTQSLAVSDAGVAATPQLVVFSGGTAFNSVAGHMRKLFPRVAHVLPVSDDGGSTAEIVRVLGGPAVGDIRSRCLRLSDDASDEARAVKRLLGHRLASYDPEAAKTEWYAIVEGEHALWNGVSEPYKHTIRAFLVHFHTTILSSPLRSQERFTFRNGSVGNFFFAGARTFFSSLDAAIFLFSRVARLPLGSSVIPAISTEERITLGAELADGSRIRGQNAISHPHASASEHASSSSSIVDKDGATAALPAAIRRVLYLTNAGTGIEHEVRLTANAEMVRTLGGADAVIYGMGSLYTSICPSLILAGVGEAVAARRGPKILLLNGSHDRETSTCLAHGGAMTAVDFVHAVTAALNRTAGRVDDELDHPSAAYVNAIMVPSGSAVAVDEAALARLGIHSVTYVQSHRDERGRPQFDADQLLLSLHALFVDCGIDSRHVE